MINVCHPDIDAGALMATPCTGSCFLYSLLSWLLHCIPTCQVVHYKHPLLPLHVDVPVEIALLSDTFPCIYFMPFLLAHYTVQGSALCDREWHM